MAINSCTPLIGFGIGAHVALCMMFELLYVLLSAKSIIGDVFCPRPPFSCSLNILQGFTLTCQTYPCGPGLKVLLNQYDTVYEMQYGQYEIKADEPKKKMFGIF